MGVATRLAGSFANETFVVGTFVGAEAPALAIVPDEEAVAVSDDQLANDPFAANDRLSFPVSWMSLPSCAPNRWTNTSQS